MKKLRIIVSVIIIVLVICFVRQLYRERKVEFADDKMRQVICLELGKDKDGDEVMYKELDKIEKIKVGAIGDFETLEDLAKCREIKELWVNVGILSTDASYKLFEKNQLDNVYPPAPTKKIPEIEKNLDEIFKNNKGIEKFLFSNHEESCNIKSLEFLKYAHKLKKLGISYGNLGDYSDIEYCRNLESLDLLYCDIKSADLLLKLKNIKTIDLTGTPLSKNEKEMKRLQDALPDVEIFVGDMQE